MEKTQMANDPNSKFARGTKTPSVNPEVKDMHWGQRATKYNRERVARNRFGDPVGESSETQHAAEQAGDIATPWQKANLAPKAVAVGAGGTKLSPELLALRQQVADEKDAGQTKQVNDAYLQGIAASVDLETASAIFQTFLAKWEDELLSCEFNHSNILRAWEHAQEQRMVDGFTIAALEKCYFWLRDNGYIARRDHRGAAAPKVWERPTTQEPAETACVPSVSAIATVHPKGIPTVSTVRASQGVREPDVAGQDPKKMPLEELRRAMRRTYNTNREL